MTKFRFEIPFGVADLHHNVLMPGCFKKHNKMNEQEKEVMELLVQAHNKFIDLPVQHPNDKQEWVSKFHELQRMLMARVAVRANPEIFRNLLLEE